MVVSALGGLAGAPAAVLSRLPVSQHHEPGDQDPGAGSVVAEQVAGTQFQLLQVLPLAGLQCGESPLGIFRRPKLDFQQGGHFPIYSFEVQAGISAPSPHSVESGK